MGSGSILGHWQVTGPPSCSWEGCIGWGNKGQLLEMADPMGSPQGYHGLVIPITLGHVPLIGGVSVDSGAHVF